jgi:uncharacterized protein YbjT (DUF2867 family)
MIVVSTPTGNIGSKLAALLLERGEDVRVIARDPSKLAVAVQEGAETIVGSHADPAALDAALAGADANFLIVPPNGQADSVEGHYVEYGRQARAAIERNGVGHAVMISTMGGGNDRAGHLSAARAAEAELGRSGASVRAIAPPFFMENLLNQVPAIESGVIALPSDADRILPVVAATDLSAVAAELLGDRSWTGVGRVPVSSSDSLTPVEVTRTVAEVLGRDLTFQQIPTDRYAEQLRGYGMSAAWADGIAEMAVAQNAGFYDDEIAEARGKTPTTLAEWTESVLKPALAA